MVAIWLCLLPGMFAPLPSPFSFPQYPILNVGCGGYSRHCPGVKEITHVEGISLLTTNRFPYSGFTSRVTECSNDHTGDSSFGNKFGCWGPWTGYNNDYYQFALSTYLSIWLHVGF